MTWLNSTFSVRQQVMKPSVARERFWDDESWQNLATRQWTTLGASHVGLEVAFRSSTSQVRLRNTAQDHPLDARHRMTPLGSPFCAVGYRSWRLPEWRAAHLSGGPNVRLKDQRVPILARECDFRRCLSGLRPGAQLGHGHSRFLPERPVAIQEKPDSCGAGSQGEVDPMNTMPVARPPATDDRRRTAGRSCPKMLGEEPAVTPTGERARLSHRHVLFKKPGQQQDSRPSTYGGLAMARYG